MRWQVAAANRATRRQAGRTGEWALRSLADGAGAQIAAGALRVGF